MPLLQNTDHVQVRTVLRAHHSPLHIAPSPTFLAERNLNHHSLHWAMCSLVLHLCESLAHQRKFHSSVTIASYLMNGTLSPEIVRSEITPLAVWGRSNRGGDRMRRSVCGADCDPLTGNKPICSLFVQDSATVRRTFGAECTSPRTRADIWSAFDSCSVRNASSTAAGVWSRSWSTGGQAATCSIRRGSQPEESTMLDRDDSRFWSLLLCITYWVQ